MASQVKKPSKLNEVVFKSYQDVITKRMKAGEDVSKLTNRLNTLLSKDNSVLLQFSWEDPQYG